jgi:acetoin:2,6-dichlorophenolindophenol oxidoreductase subunit alpha
MAGTRRCPLDIVQIHLSSGSAAKVVSAVVVVDHRVDWMNNETFSSYAHSSAYFDAGEERAPSPLVSDRSGDIQHATSNPRTTTHNRSPHTAEAIPAATPRKVLASSRSDLDELLDPAQFSGLINIEGVDRELLKRMVHDMRLIRHTEEMIANLAQDNVIGTPCHLGIGQEAVAVGVSAHLRPSDRVFGGHRSHSHYLAMGGDLYRLFAEVLGKADGASRGMGGSMHLCAHSVGFHGSVPLVGATIPIAVGAALAAMMQGSGDVGVAYFGDGATEEGVLHESLNLASLYRLPVLFVCENNLFSSHLDIGLRQPSDRIARFAEAHRVAACTIDGNDILAVSRAAQGLLARARAGAGPGFLEAVTYRHRGHVGWMDDIDVGVRRKMEDLVVWKKRDPIQRLEGAMVRAEIVSREQLAEGQAALQARIQSACERAIAAPYPPVSTLLRSVFQESGSDE